MPADMPPVEAVPVTTECVMQIASSQRIPVASLIGILAQEAGSVGKATRNTNNTYDYGPMQINTIWLPELSKHGITEEALRWNGCLNVAVGAMILRYHMTSSNGDIWKAIGNYHSKTPKHHERYVRNVWARMQSIRDIRQVIDRSNAYLMKLMGKHQ